MTNKIFLNSFLFFLFPVRSIDRDVKINSEFYKVSSCSPDFSIKVRLNILPRERFKGKRYPDEPKTIGELLRKIRLERGLKVKEVADLLGVTDDTVLNWELRGKKPSRKVFPKLLNFLKQFGFSS